MKTLVAASSSVMKDADSAMVAVVAVNVAKAVKTAGVVGTTTKTSMVDVATAFFVDDCEAGHKKDKESSD